MTMRGAKFAHHKTMLSLLAVISTFGPCSHAAIPTAEMNVFLSDAPPTMSKYNLLASQAFFGSSLPMQSYSGEDDQPTLLRVQLPPDDNPNLCNPPTRRALTRRTATESVNEDTAMLVPRGQCTFETKAYHAQKLGAKAVIIHGALSSHYSLNTTTDNGSKTSDDIVWPVSLNDYDCDKGSALITDAALSFDPLPYDAANNDPLLSGDTSQNMCMELSTDFLKDCPSKACVLTGKKGDDDKSWEACCVWDLFVLLYSDSAFHQPNDTTRIVDIPALYLTLQEGQQLLRDLKTNSSVRLALYERWRPRYNPSSALIWMMAVSVAAVAAYLSAHDYRAKLRQVLQAQARGEAGQDEDDNNASSERRMQQRQKAQQEETLELNAWHSLAFVVMASSSLLILFYFKIYGFVKVMYAFGCSKALGTILLSPVIDRVMGRLQIPDPVVCDTGIEDIGEITLRDLLAHLISYSLGLVWLVLAFTNYHPETITFFWVVQDIFGACMCILFLQVIKLNSIRVASILLVIAFFYDIFFVFLSPLIFSKSVMIDVATSGGPPPNPEWCEKYPDDPTDCQQRGNPLPMLLTVPRIADYAGGANLLGLGDIVVPGLLLSFAARFDAAKSLLGVMGGGNGSLGRSYTCPERKYCGSTCWTGGYYIPGVIAYGIGLMMADVAVYLMDMGQPALLYLVPCCLGMVLFIGWWRIELADLWDGPRAIRAADVICYGEPQHDTAEGNAHAPIPQQEDDRFEGSNSKNYSYDSVIALSVPSATDEDDHGAR